MENLSRTRMFMLARIAFLSAMVSACGMSTTVSRVGTESAASKVTCAYPSGSKSVSVNWDANHEKSVNSAGGGYRVYYCATQDFSVDGAAFIDVPGANSATTATTATIPKIGKGTLYVKVVAYSAMTYAGTIGVKSTASTEITVAVP